MSNSPAYIVVPIRYKNSLGDVSQASVARLQLVFADPGATGSQGVGIDISGYTSFVQNSGGAFTPTTATLSALLTNVTSPTYSWAISGATPTSSTSSSVVVTPTSLSTGVTVTLTVNGSNLLAPISKTISMPVVYDGAPGTAGANGIMSAFPTIYIWTGSSTPPTRPTTTSTYTWSTGAFTPPSGWSATAPSNTTAGNYLWAITYPLTVSATTTTSTLDWTDTSNAIRAIAYNGANGTSGTSGSATFVVTRVANDSSAPTNSEVNAVIGRNPVAGDIVTVSYNSALNAVVYRYTTTWVTQATYLTGSLIVDGTITAPKLSVTSLSAINANLGTVTAGEVSIGTSPAISGTAMTGTGSHIYSDGRMVVGNSTNSMVFDGSTLTINGNIVSYGNLNGTAIGQIIAGSINFVAFTSSSTFTVPANVYKLKVTVIGGGGGGGRTAYTNVGGGGGGGAGGGTIKVLSVTPGWTFTVTVGGGGAGGTSSTGSSGGNSVFTGNGFTITANGGGGGGGGTATGGSGGAGGTCTGGDINLQGGSGGYGTPQDSGSFNAGAGGSGGGAPFIGTSAGANTAASANSGGGGGGGGNANAARNGAAGGSGLVIVEY